MSINGWFQIAIFLALILLATKPLGVFMTRVFSRERTFLDPVMRPVGSPSPQNSSGCSRTAVLLPARLPT